MSKGFWLTTVFLAGMAGLAPGAASKEKPVFYGVDANYALQMEQDGRTWKWGGREGDLFAGMAKQGGCGFRLRLWTGENGPGGKVQATEIMRRALAAGLEPYLVLFLSEDWADLMKQPLPKIWSGLDLDQRAEAVRVYSRDVVAHFRKAGLRSHLYEIGNEIDYGIGGVYPGKNTKKNPESLAATCWPEAAKLILASEQGVKEADPDARFLLHVAHWWDAEFCIAFYRFMLDHGVQVDYAGLSYYPSANIGGSLEMEQFGDVVNRIFQAVKRPLIVPEVAYPSTTDFKGQFSRWKSAAPGYPPTPDGQRRWLADFLAYCAHTPAIDSVYYWSPEWYGEGMWKAFALFDVAGEAKPAWQAFSGDRARLPAPKRPRFFEIRGERIYPVPIGEARAKAIPELRQKLARTGQVNMDYIKAVTATELIVEGYRVNLRASLSGNLDLVLSETAPAPPAWKASLAQTDAATEKIVIFAADQKAPAVVRALSDARARGIEAVVHEKPDDQPLKFGLGNGWQSAAGD